VHRHVVIIFMVLRYICDPRWLTMCEPSGIPNVHRHIVIIFMVLRYF